MIEVNLLPGGKKGSGGGGFSFSMPDVKALFKGGGSSGGGLPADPYLLFLIGALVVGLGYMGFTFWRTSSQAEDLAVQLEVQRQDSIRFATTIEAMNQLQARGDSIARRVAIIQEIDANRFTWPHLLDEVAAAVPDYTWLREILYSGDNPLQVRVTGRASSIAAITTFMRRLEASPFLSNVLPETIQRVSSEENAADLVQEFEFVLFYEPPPMEELQSVPLFEEASAQAAAPAEGN